MSEYTPEQLSEYISKIFNAVLSTKNISSTYIVLIAFASLFVDAYDQAGISFAISSYTNYFSYVSSWLQSFGLSSIAIGAAVGSAIGGWLTDRIGRRSMFLVNMTLFTVAALLAGISTNIFEFSAFRIALGFAVGADTATGFAYIFEYLERNQRLKWSNYWQLAWYPMYLATIGFLIVPYFLITGSLTDPFLWRVVMFVGAGLGLILLILRSRMPESIMWEAYRGRIGTAKRLLMEKYGIIVDVPNVDQVVKRPARSLRSLFKVYRSEKWKVLLFAIIGAQAINLSFYSYGYFFPYLITILGFKGSIAKIEADSVVYAAGVVGGFLSGALTLKIGTKRLWEIGAWGMAGSVTLDALTYAFHLPLDIFVAGTTLYIFFESLCVSNLITTINASYSVEERGTATGWYYFWAKIASIVGLAGGLTYLNAVRLSTMIFYVVILSVAALIGLLVEDATKITPPELQAVRAK